MTVAEGASRELAAQESVRWLEGTTLFGRLRPVLLRTGLYRGRRSSEKT
jgi:hypothetical protein